MLAFSKQKSDDLWMRAARLAVFEDHPPTLDLIRLMLDGTSHEVVAEATTRNDAFEVIAAMQAGELLVNAALLDGNLDRKDKVMFGDGRAIHQRLREHSEDLPILGISSSELAAEGIPIPRTLDIMKYQIPILLVETLDQLPEPDVA